MHCFWCSVFINHKINNRSRHWRCSIYKGALKTFAGFTGKHLCQCVSLQLYYKRDSGTGFFLWILQNPQENIFHRTPPGDCLCNKILAVCQFFYLVKIFAIQENVTWFIVFMKYLSFLETFRSFWRCFNLPMTFYYFGDFVLLHNKEIILWRYPRE